MVQANGCRPGESSIPSSSTTEKSMSWASEQEPPSHTIDKTLEQQEEKISSRADPTRTLETKPTREMVAALTFGK